VPEQLLLKRESMMNGLQKMSRCLALMVLAIGAFAAAHAQNYVYSNNVTSPNGVTGYSVGSDGSLTVIPGSPFAAVGDGGGGYFASRQIAVWGNFLFASNSDSNSIAVFSIAPSTGALTAVPGSPFALTGVSAGNSISLAVSPSGNYLFTGSDGITVQAIGENGALTQLSSIASSNFSTSIDTIDVSPDGQFLAYTDTTNIGIFTIAASGALTAATGSPISGTTDGGQATSVLFTPNNSSGNRLYVGYSGTNPATVVTVYDVAANGSLTAISGSPFTFSVGDNPNCIGIAPNGQYLYVASQQSGDVSPTVLNIASNGALSLASAPGTSGAASSGSGTNIVVSADNQFVYSGSFEGPIYDFSIGSGGSLSNPHTGQANSGFNALSVAAYPAPQGIPLASPSPSSLTFPSQQFQTESAEQTVTISNNGAENLVISSGQISGANANDFSQIDTCTSPVPQGGSCSITVTFTPTAVGARSASLVITDNSGGQNGTSQTVTLQGTAIQQTPTVAVSPVSIGYQSNSTELTAQVAYVGNTAPTGAVTFTVDSGAAVVGTCSRTGSSLNCTASYSIGQLPVGPHTITATLAADTNFASASSTAQLTITQIAPVITFSIPNHTYGAAPFTLSATSTSNGAMTYTVVSGPARITNSTLTITGAGQVVAQVTQQPDANHLAGTQSASLNVAPASLTVTASSASMTYGGTVPTITASYSGFVGSDSAASLTAQPVCSTTVTSHSAVASYPSSCSGAVDANYTISYTAGSVTVGKASLAISASSASMTYGGTVPTITASYSGFVGTDSAASLTAQPVCSTTATSHSANGGYPSSCSGAVDANYTVSYTAGSVTVGKAALTITASSGSMTYGETVPVITASYSGFGGGDSAASLTSQPVCSTTATSNNAIGSYPSSCSGAVDANYSISYVTGTMSVAGAALVVTANNSTRVYGAANPQFTGSVTDQQDGDTFTEGFTTTATASSPVGSYSIVPSVAGAHLSDYELSVSDGTLTITQAASNTTLQTSSASITPGNDVTLTATVTSTTTGAPTGTVNFYDGGVLLNSTPAALSAGVATFVTGVLAPGMTHSITATYSGNTNFAGSSATGAITVAVAPMDFTMALAGSANLTVMPGQSVSYKMQVAPLYGSYAGTVNFAIAGLPSNATATFSPSSIAADGGPQTVTVTIQTAATTALLHDQPASNGRRYTPIALGFLLLFGTGTLRKRRCALRALLSVLVLAGVGAMASLTTGCGANTGFFAQSPQNYSVTVTAKASNLEHTSTFTLNVQ
jgi:6-phosphogluconolactonase (cycloisomerase 2 family)